jgi:lysozyme
MSRSINDTGLGLIKSFESCKLKTYKDIKGILTIGWGHTGEDVTPDLIITQDDADYLLEQDLQWFENGVDSLVGDKANDNQFAALISFSYNLGLKTLQGSTLLRDFLAGDVQAAADQFVLWDHAGGVEVPGLLRRRQAERDIFLS